MVVFDGEPKRTGEPCLSDQRAFGQRHGFRFGGFKCRLDGGFCATSILHDLGNLRLGQAGEEGGSSLLMLVHVDFQGCGQLIGMGQPLAVIIVLGLDCVDIGGGDDRQ